MMISFPCAVISAAGMGGWLGCLTQTLASIVCISFLFFFFLICISFVDPNPLRWEVLRFVLCQLQMEESAIDNLIMFINK